VTYKGDIMRIEQLFELSLATYAAVANEAPKRVLPAITGADKRGGSIRRGVKHANAAATAKKKIAKLTFAEDEEMADDC
jgi:hypothetical protein